MSIAIVGVTSPSPQTAALTVASVHLAGLQQTHLSHNRPHPLFGKKTLFHSGGSSTFYPVSSAVGAAVGKKKKRAATTGWVFLLESVR